MTTAIGTHRHQVTVQAPGAAVPDGDGGFTEDWVTLVPAPWRCAIVPATAKDLERVAAGTVISTATHILTGRYHPGLAAASTTARIVFGTRVFSVTGVFDPEERHLETIATGVELLGAPPV